MLDYWDLNMKLHYGKLVFHARILICFQEIYNKRLLKFCCLERTRHFIYFDLLVTVVAYNFIYYNVKVVFANLVFNLIYSFFIRRIDAFFRKDDSSGILGATF